MDELISSRVSSAPQLAGIPANHETASGQASAITPLPEGPVPIGSLVFADELPDGVVVADETGRIVVFNRVAARLTGLDPAEVTISSEPGQPSPWLDCDTDEDLAAARTFAGPGKEGER